MRFTALFSLLKLLLSLNFTTLLNEYRYRKTAWQRFKDLFRSFVAFVFSKVGICVLVVGYLLLGAFAFQAIEAPAEAEIKYNMSTIRNMTGSVH